METIKKMFVVCAEIPEKYLKGGLLTGQIDPADYVIGVHEWESNARKQAEAYAKRNPGSSVTVCSPSVCFKTSEPVVSELIF